MIVDVNAALSLLQGSRQRLLPSHVSMPYLLDQPHEPGCATSYDGL